MKLQLSEHFDYPNTLRSQRVRISDFLLYLHGSGPAIICQLCIIAVLRSVLYLGHTSSYDVISGYIPISDSTFLSVWVARCA